jgi:peptide deformylase
MPATTQPAAKLPMKQLEIVKYGHPVLRQKGARVERVTPEIQALAADMLETMRVNKGVGLAAQQIGQALQLTVVDLRGVTDPERPSTLKVDGKDTDVAGIMPLVLVNPSLTLSGETVSAPEGCLSFPEIYGDIARPSRAEVRATNEQGQIVQFSCGGFLARVIQHEFDHLNGVLFIDRMSRETKDELKTQLEELQAVTKAELKAKK